MVGAHIITDEDNQRKIENDGINFLRLCADTDEIEIFYADSIKELVRFRWDTQGFKFHAFGLIMHMIYIVVLLLYTQEGFIHGELNHNLSYGLLAFQLYPFFYEIIQLCHGGWDYFSDFGNFIDIIYIASSVVMTVIHANLGAEHAISKFLMCLVGALAFRRTLTYLRILNTFSVIVLMLQNVISELRFFLSFYFIECMLFSLMLDVCGIGNYKIFGKFRTTWWTYPT